MKRFWEEMEVLGYWLVMLLCLAFFWAIVVKGCLP